VIAGADFSTVRARHATLAEGIRMSALLQTSLLARLVARFKGKTTNAKPEPEWKIRYRQSYGQDPPPWRMGNEPEVVIAWVREYRALKGELPPLSMVQEVFSLPKTTAWRRLRNA
jgi:hypothetical protein